VGLCGYEGNGRTDDYMLERDAQEWERVGNDPVRDEVRVRVRDRDTQMRMSKKPDPETGWLVASTAASLGAGVIDLRPVSEVTTLLRSVGEVHGVHCALALCRCIHTLLMTRALLYPCTFPCTSAPTPRPKRDGTETGERAPRRRASF
jgi:hypothetical protein